MWWFDVTSCCASCRLIRKAIPHVKKATPDTTWACTCSMDMYTTWRIYTTCYVIWSRINYNINHNIKQLITICFICLSLPWLHCNYLYPRNLSLALPSYYDIKTLTICAWQWGVTMEIMIINKWILWMLSDEEITLAKPLVKVDVLVSCLLLDNHW